MIASLRHSLCISQGTGNRPTIICHIDICESLWSMGVRADQMKGYFGGDANSWSALCHGTHCMSAHFEQMERVNQPGSTYAIDMAKVALVHAKDETTKTLAAQIIKDQEREIAEMREWLSKNAPK